MFTGNWHGFIRAHLELIHDERNWSIHSKTRFVRELETLGLDVPALLLGSVLQINNAPYGRYMGSVSRTGWALAQCKDADQVAEALRLAIADDQLDDQNRLILYRVYQHMVLRKYALQFGMKEHQTVRKQAESELKQAQSVLPHPWRTSLEGLTQW